MNSCPVIAESLQTEWPNAEARVAPRLATRAPFPRTLLASRRELVTSRFCGQASLLFAVKIAAATSTAATPAK